MTKRMDCHGLYLQENLYDILNGCDAYAMIFFLLDDCFYIELFVDLFCQALLGSFCSKKY